jgi:hypothetical protein
MRTEKQIANLKPIKTLSKEEAMKRGKAGGKKSVKARREKKLMTQIYAEFLAKKHDVINKNGIKEKVDGDVLLARVMSKVLSRGDSSAVSLMKEIREATEGNKLDLSGSGNFVINIKGVEPDTTE